MYVHPEGLEFRYEGGMTAAGVADRASGELFGVAIDYAERAGDYRLSMQGNAQETGMLEEHQRICAQSLAGFAIITADFSGLPLALRVEDAPEYGGFCVRTNELEFLGDMVEWLAGRTNVQKLPNGKRLDRIRPVVLQVLRLAQSNARLEEGQAAAS